MKICSVTDGYINYLRTYYPHVYMNKEDTRVHTRKYIGIVLSIDNINYYIPLSSPKLNKDYKVLENGELYVFKNSFTVFRIYSNQDVKGTIQFAYMIPVPNNAIIEYDANSEDDENYKNLIMEEIKYIRKNEEKIKKRAVVIYTKKNRGDTDKIMDKCLDFKGLEQLCANWQKLVT